MREWFNTKGSGFRCIYGFVSEVLTLRVASGILPAMFLRFFFTGSTIRSDAVLT